MNLKEIYRHTNYFRHRALLRSHPDFAKLVERPIFIVGCGHSGTTLLLRIVGSHPNIHPLLDESAVFIKERTYLLRDFDMEAYAAGKKRWLEKTPLHIQYIDSIFKYRPHAQVLIIVRDGRDVAASIKARRGTVESAIRRWVRDNEAGEKWDQDPRVMRCRYEDLITDFDVQVRSITNFLGEEYDDSMSAYHQKLKHAAQPDRKPDSETGENHLQHRLWQVSQPIFDGRGRWVDQLNPTEMEHIVEKAGTMLQRYGYLETTNT